VIPDNVQCYSDYEPRSVYSSSSLRKQIIQGLNSKNYNDFNLDKDAWQEKTEGWKSIIYENLVHRNFVQKNLKMGYLDFKYLVFGDIHSGPLSMVISPQKDGPV
jgi:hypothetical protein